MKNSVGNRHLGRYLIGESVDIFREYLYFHRVFSLILMDENSIDLFLLVKFVRVLNVDVRILNTEVRLFIGRLSMWKLSD